MSCITIIKYDFTTYYCPARSGPPGRRHAVIRLRLAEVLAERGWTPYRLARETGLTVPTAYRLADPALRFGRFTADTLERLCAALEVQPGDLLEWVPSGRRRDAASHGRVRKAAAG
jgi:putative transcriptional regulator